MPSTGPLWLALPLALISCGTLPGGAEPGGCTEIGCEDGLSVSVTPTEAWPHGNYRYTVEHDGTTVVCTGDLPLPACEQRALTCDAEDVWIVESGCALDPSAHAFGDITLPSSPTEVSVTIELDDQVVGSGSWTPAYETSQPNGPGCGPVCTSATVSLALDFG